jgi:hypothetical protein
LRDKEKRGICMMRWMDGWMDGWMDYEAYEEINGYPFLFLNCLKIIDSW